jgi:hypothetical protein
MALTRRGRSLVGSTAVVLVVAVVFGVMVACGKSGPPSANGAANGGGDGSATSPSPVLRICPLTGKRAAGGVVPNRPALAVKVENLPAARPQTGLSWADIVYEEPVEANITRFIVVYQCQGAERIEPVRSGRLTDPLILMQFGRPVFGYAGGVPAVLKAVRAAGLTDVNFNNAPQAYHRDPARPAPHNLYTSSTELYAAAGKAGAGGIPKPVFTFSTDLPATAKPASSVHVPFSQYSDVVWSWSSSRSAWMRSYGSVPATYSNGEQMSVPNVVIQMVKVRMTGITDVNGVHSPEVVATGSGKALILRNGSVIAGTWSRPKLSDLTVFKDAQGNVIPLAPGKSWVELVPNAVHVSVR